MCLVILGSLLVVFCLILANSNSMFIQERSVCCSVSRYVDRMYGASLYRQAIQVGYRQAIQVGRGGASSVGRTLCGLQVQAIYNTLNSSNNNNPLATNTRGVLQPAISLTM